MCVYEVACANVLTFTTAVEPFKGNTEIENIVTSKGRKWQNIKDNCLFLILTKATETSGIHKVLKPPFNF